MSREIVLKTLYISIVFLISTALGILSIFFTDKLVLSIVNSVFIFAFSAFGIYLLVMLFLTLRKEENSLLKKAYYTFIVYTAATAVATVMNPLLLIPNASIVIKIIWASSTALAAVSGVVAYTFLIIAINDELFTDYSIDSIGHGAMICLGLAALYTLAYVVLVVLNILPLFVMLILNGVLIALNITASIVVIYYLVKANDLFDRMSFNNEDLMF